MLRTFRSFVAAATLLPLPALAAHPLVSDDTGTQGDRRWTLELNGEAARDRAAGAIAESANAAATLSLGAGEAVDLVFGVPAAWSRSRDGGTVLDQGAGAADARMELKWRFLDGDGFSLAVKPGVSLPTGDAGRGFGAGSLGYGLTLIATRQLGPVALHLNGAWFHADHDSPDGASSRHDAFHASLAAVAEVAQGLQLAGNLAVETPAERGGAWPAYALVGAIYSLSDRVDLDLGVRGALNAAAPDLALLAGAAWRF
jgi:hypothetical protein